MDFDLPSTLLLLAIGLASLAAALLRACGIKDVPNE